MQPGPMNERVAIASYPLYGEAQAAVDRLSDAKFPVEDVSIVGRDLRLVESVTGRLDWGRAALRGLATGAWFGLLVGLFVAIFVANDTTSWFALVLWGLLFGALAGLVFSLVSYGLTGGQRDFVSVSSLVAARYDVMVDTRTADEARRVLGLGAGSGDTGMPYERETSPRHASPDDAYQPTTGDQTQRPGSTL
jgi:hypothetical protein